jgi:hypothetical protein
MASPDCISLHRRNLSAGFHLHARRRLASSGNRTRHFARDGAEVSVGDIRGERNLAPHVVPVVLACHRAVAQLGHVADEHLAVLGPLQRNLR